MGRESILKQGKYRKLGIERTDSWTHATLFEALSLPLTSSLHLSETLFPHLQGSNHTYLAEGEISSGIF